MLDIINLFGMNKEDRKKSFIERAKEIHKDEELDFSKVVYINNRTKVIIIDKEYGEFEITPSNLLSGKSHPLRRGIKIAEKKKSSTEEVIERIKEVHKDKQLDFSKFVYKNMNSNVIVIDKEYGEFETNPHSLLKGCCHPNRNKLTFDKFINKAKEIHNGKYDYSNVEINRKDKITIICPIHGEFKQEPYSHLNGRGCPKCSHSISKEETEIVNFIKNIDSSIEIIERDKTVLEGKELDISLPKYNLAIEYNGILFHSDRYGKDKDYHINKTISCNDKNITLLQIFEDEYIKHKDAYLNLIHSYICKDKINISNSNIVVKEVELGVVSDYIKMYGLSDETSHSKRYFGAFLDGLMVGCIICTIYDRKCFKIAENGFISSYNVNNTELFKLIVGYIISTENVDIIDCILDRNLTNINDNICLNNGFVLVEIIEPIASYFNVNKHSEKYNRKKIKEDNDITVFDCGLLKYRFKIK